MTESAKRTGCNREIAAALPNRMSRCFVGPAGAGKLLRGRGGRILSCALLLLLLVIPVRPAPAEEAGSTDPFSDAHFLLLDEEMIVLRQPYGSAPYSDVFLPNNDNFRDGEWRDLNDRRASWTPPPPRQDGKIGKAAILVRDDRNTQYLAQVWEVPASVPGVSYVNLLFSLTPVDQNGYKAEAGHYRGYESVRPGTMGVAAGDCNGDRAKELIVGYGHATGGNFNVEFLVLPTSFPWGRPVSFSSSSIPRMAAGSGIRLAAGDVNGDGKDEFAAMYVAESGYPVVVLFDVDLSRWSVRVLGVHQLDEKLWTPFYGPDYFDLAFADWEGNGRAMLACLSTYGSSPRIRLLRVEKSETGATFSTVFTRDIWLSSSPWLNGPFRLRAADLDGDGRDEMVTAFPRSGNEASVAVLYHAGEQHALAELTLRKGSVGIGSDLLLETGSFSGKLHPTAAAKNKGQAVVLYGTQLTLLSLERRGQGAWIDIRSWIPFPYVWSSAHLLVGDLDGDSMLLGYPTHITLENQISPILFLNEPPKHIDRDTSGSVTNYTRQDALFIQYAQSEAESKETTNTLAVESNLGGSLGTEAEGGVDLGVVQASVKVKASINASVGKKEQDMARNYAAQSTSLMGQTNRDDFILYRCHKVHLWRYPILGWFSVPEGKTREGQTHYQVAIPGSSAEDQAVYFIAGRNVGWYHPVHMNGNVLSYPSGTGQLGDYKSENLLSGLVTLDVGGGNRAVRTIEWGSEQAREKLKSQSVLMGLDLEVQSSASAQVRIFKGNVTTTASFHMDERTTRTSSSTTSVTKKNAFAVEVPALSSPLAYTITPLMYRTDGGVLKTPHLAGNIAGQTAWNARYGAASDPALNLPHLWQYRNDTWRWSENDDGTNPEARKIRGIFFRRKNGTDLGTSIPLGEAAVIAVRVHNFSLKDCPSVEVRAEVVPYDPQTGKTTGDPVRLESFRTPTINRWGASRANWEEATFQWNTASFTEGNYRVLVTVNPEGTVPELPERALHEPFDNNHGWYEVFLHRRQADLAEEVAEKGLDLDEAAPNLVAGLDIANTPEDGRSFDPEEIVLLRGSVRNEGDVPTSDIVLFFFDGDPDRGGTAFASPVIAGIKPNGTYSLTVPHIFETPGSRRVFLRVVPKVGDPPEDNTATVFVPVKGDSGSGCSVGSAGAGAAVLLLAAPLLLLRRR